MTSWCGCTSGPGGTPARACSVPPCRMRWTGSASTCGSSRSSPGLRSASRSWAAAGRATSRTGRRPPPCGAGTCSPRRLAEDAPPVSEPDQYRYDPAEPTPAVGGTSTGPNSGPKDNRELEARPDVLTYSTGPLAAEVEITGPVRAELYVTSTLAHTDFFARLCDVDPKGRSVNVTDGLIRLARARHRAQRPARCWSTCGRPRTGSRPGTGSGFRSPAAPTPGSPGTRAPGSRWPPPPPCRSPSRPCTTTRTTPRRSCCPWSADRGQAPPR